MISLDQVQLLEHKVETVVAKITDLQKENDFLRSKFSELKVQYDEMQKANVELSAKVSLYEQNQPTIESGIMKALERLNNIEDSVLRVSGGRVEASISMPEQNLSSIPSGENSVAQSISAQYVASSKTAQQPAPSANPFPNITSAVPQQKNATETQQLDIF
jgi:chromosome segregation ATPase